MINIVDIVDQINLKEEMEKSKDKCEFEWKPEECTDYRLPTFQIPSVRSKKSTEETLSKVLTFIDWSKYKRLAHGCTIMPIPTTNKRLVDICGSQRQVSNLIKFMCKIGLLALYCRQAQCRRQVPQSNPHRSDCQAKETLPQERLYGFSF